MLALPLTNNPAPLQPALHYNTDTTAIQPYYSQLQPAQHYNVATTDRTPLCMADIGSTGGAGLAVRL